MKEDLELLVERIQDADASLHAPALTQMREKIRAATSTMTSVPKPLKFLRAHYDTVKAAREKMTSDADKETCADIISLLATTVENDTRDCLQFRLKGSSEALSYWGHEYVRHLQGEIAAEYSEFVEAVPPKPVEHLMAMAAEIVPYHVSHNAEADACDLCMEIERLDLLAPCLDEASYPRACLYLQSCVPFVPEPEDSLLLRTCLGIFRQFERWPQAMQMALKLNDPETIRSVFADCPDTYVRRQLAYMLGRQQVYFELDEVLDEDEVGEEELETLRPLMANEGLNASFSQLARELDIVEPKSPEDIYKTHLESKGRSSAMQMDSERANLAATFVNGFVNAGFGRDSLILDHTEDRWIYRNKDHGQMSAVASMGLLLLWDYRSGLTKIDPLIYVDNDYIKAGVYLAYGVVCSTVRPENEPALALLQDVVLHKKPLFRVGANMGLGLAYAGTANEVVGDLLLPVLEDEKSTMEVIGVTALALGQVYVGTCDGTVAEALITKLMSCEPKELIGPHAKNVALGLGLLFLGKQTEAEVTLATLGAIGGAFGKLASVLVEACAYAGTGNVLKIQKLLHMCSEHFEDEVAAAAEAATARGEGEAAVKAAIAEAKAKVAEQVAPDAHQAFATLGLAMVAMGEEVGIDMALRSMSHLLQYGEPIIRRAVPVAMALLCVSNPVLSVMDTLSKLSHDADAEVAYNSILALGLIGAGTNHARIGGLLRQLAQYYHKDPNALLCVRLAQGLLHTGKGSITLSPFHTDRSLMTPAGAAGLLSFLIGLLDVKNTVLKSQHYSLFNLCISMYPRILSTFDEHLEPVTTSVRVGQAVDVVGQAGKPKTITGFVTNTTPVLLGYGERAQLASEEYEALTPLLEGFVIVKRKEEGEEEAKDGKK